MSGLRTLLQPICGAVFLIVILLHSWSVSAHAETTDPGQINFRQDIKDTQDEFIDPYTGTLRLKYIDYSLPGNGGLDLNIYRVYSTEYATEVSTWPMTLKGDWSTRWEQSPLGFGWAIHFGRMSPNAKIITVELQDGTKSKLVRQDDETWISAEFWKLTSVMDQGKAYYTLYLPDGRQIEFGKFDDDNLDLLHYRYATKISYNGSNDTYITINYEEDSRRISSVVDSLGRVIYFNYSEISNGLMRLTSLGFQHPNNHIVQYFYEGTAVAEIDSTVTRVETGIGDPAPETWTYEYKKYHDPEAYSVEKVHTPMGGTIQYNFKKFSKLCYGTGSTTQFSVERKTLSGNGFASNATWKYNYGIDELDDNTTKRYVNYSMVTDPEQRTTYYHFTDYQSELEDCYKCGLLQKKFIMEPDTTPHDPTDNPISYAEINTWEKLESPLSFDGFYADCQCDNSRWSVPVLKKQVILHGQDVLEYVPHPGLIYHWRPKYDNASVFTAEYFQHDEYGNPTEIRETGSLYKNYSLQWSTSRDITNIYWIVDNGPYYIVKNKPDIVTIQGDSPDQQTPFGGSFTIDYEYGYNINDLEKVSKIDQYGVVTEYGYDDSNGNLRHTMDGNTNEVNKYTYYSWDKGSISKIETPEYEVSRVINPDGTVHSETNGRGYTTNYSYYKSKRLKQIFPPIGNPTTFTYFDADGYLAEKNVSRDGFDFTTKYNGLGKEIETTDSVGNRTNTSYYANGLLSTVSSNTGDTIYYDYFGHMTGRKHLGDTAASVHYDYQNEAELFITDEEGFVTTHLFKYFGDPSEKYLTEVRREVKLEDNLLPGNDDIFYQYNVLGNLTHTYRGDSYTNDFDEQGNYTYYTTNTLQQRYHSETGATTYTRWNNGEVKTITDSSGRVRTYRYDRNNRLDEVLSNNVVMKDFKYDGEELWKADSEAADIIYGYDESSRLTSIHTCINFHPGGPTCKLSKFAYDNNDNLRFLTYPSGMVVEYKYNALNQVTDVILHGKIGGLKEIKYSTSGSSIGLLSSYKRNNGEIVSFTYDSRRRQDKMNYPERTLDYDFNVRNNLFRYTRTPWSQPSTFTATYTYDSLNRIRSYNGPWGNGEYIYYPFTDNRKSRSMGNGFQAASYTYSGNTLYQYKTFLNGAWQQKAIDFDSTGDMTVYGDLTFDYDPFHMATEVKKNSATIAEYGYDANDQRVFKKAGGFLDSNVLYYHDGKGRILSEFDHLGRLIYDYVYLGDTLVAKVDTPSNVVLSPIIFLLTNDEE